MMDVTNVRLGIACPMANEADTCVDFVGALLAECSRFPFQSVRMFVVLDGVSKDASRALLEKLALTEPRLKVVWAPQNRCIVDAYLRGYREAIAGECDWILEIDGGFSHDPADLPKFIETMAQGYDCVFGTRLGLGGSFQDVSLKRRTISRTGTLLTNLLLGTRLTDMTSGYELFSRKALQMVLDRGIRSRAHFFQTEIKVLCRHLNCVRSRLAIATPARTCPTQPFSMPLPA